MSNSSASRVVGYLKPKYKIQIIKEVEATGTTESKIIAEAVKQYYENKSSEAIKEQKNKTSTLSKHSY